MECCLVTRSPIAGPDGHPTTQDLTLEISLARELKHQETLLAGPDRARVCGTD